MLGGMRGTDIARVAAVDDICNPAASRARSCSPRRCRAACVAN